MGREMKRRQRLRGKEGDRKEGKSMGREMRGREKE